jgi:hypothetical protein
VNEEISLMQLKDTNKGLLAVVFFWMEVSLFG